MNDAAAQKAWDQKWIERVTQSLASELGWQAEKTTLRSPEDEVYVVITLKLGTNKHLPKAKQPKPDELDVEVRGAFIWPALAEFFGIAPEKAPVFEFVPRGTQGYFGGVFRCRRQASIVGAVSEIRTQLPPLAPWKATSFVVEHLLPFLRSLSEARQSPMFAAPIDFASLYPGQLWEPVGQPGQWSCAKLGWEGWPDKAFGQAAGGGTYYQEWLCIGAVLGLVQMTPERDALRDAWLAAHTPEPIASAENRSPALEMKIFGRVVS